MKCQICNSEQKSLAGIARHVVKAHDCTIKTYYDTYIKQEGEDACLNPLCDGTTTFNTIGKGYLNNYNKRKYCNLSCARSSADVQDKQRATSIKKYGNANYRNYEQSKSTCLEKYGHTNPLAKGTSAFEKRNNTVKNKYGVDNVFQSVETKERIRKVMTESGRWSDVAKEYRQYYRLAINHFKSVREAFMLTWDGFDYYDKEFIAKNHALCPNSPQYPTVDHKVPLLQCFAEGKTIQEASDFTNLCVTKKAYNSQKHCKSEAEFRQWLSEQ